MEEGISDELFSDLTYSMCRAVGELFGRSGNAYMSRVGRVLLAGFEDRGWIPSGIDDPLEILNRVFKNIVELGYADYLIATREGNEIKLEFQGIKGYGAEERLQIEDAKVKPLYITSLSIAILEKYLQKKVNYGKYGFGDGNTYSTIILEE
ncbi:MAG: hypothetical protein MOIL_01599 [Candidatus Methanolliviera sp. GoM_oil]|nr:MAG: hypothetical protein MOIL_01599 [Candidatus Methanolliviera sp. GoM_oil]